MTRWNACSVSIIEHVLGKLHCSYVWRVRIFFFMNGGCCTNLYPSEMQIPGEKCTSLIEVTANALSGDVVALMLVAVQKNSLELSINQAVKRYVLESSRARMR